jgi:hypothetical protein
MMNVTDWATISGAVAGVLALVYTGREIRQNTKVHRAEFWLTLRTMFSEHQAIHLKLRNYGWSNDDAHYPTPEDWAMLEAYMGLLEHCEIMLGDHLLDWSTFHDVYGYRIRLILSNPLIVREKLIRRREGWARFVRLVERMKKELDQSRYMCGFSERYTGRWTLWWGRVFQEEGCQTFLSREELERAYHERLTSAAGNPAARIDYAWLIEDDAVVHRWTGDAVHAVRRPKLQ